MLTICWLNKRLLYISHNFQVILIKLSRDLLTLQCQLLQIKMSYKVSWGWIVVPRSSIINASRSCMFFGQNRLIRQISQICKYAITEMIKWFVCCLFLQVSCSSSYCISGSLNSCVFALKDMWQLFSQSENQLTKFWAKKYIDLLELSREAACFHRIFILQCHTLHQKLSG